MPEPMIAASKPIVAMPQPDGCDIETDLCGTGTVDCGIETILCDTGTDGCGIESDLCGTATIVCGIATIACGIATIACGIAMNVSALLPPSGGFCSPFGVRHPQRAVPPRGINRLFLAAASSKWPW
ncbi:MAG TPA: hypothetical protein VGA84_04770 [Thermoanaerobaculia bacterium]